MHWLLFHLLTAEVAGLYDKWRGSITGADVFADTFNKVRG